MRRAKRFEIRDWANNLCFDGRTFADFETAWEYIYDQARKELGVKPAADLNDVQEEEFNDICGEYYVEEVRK